MRYIASVSKILQSMETTEIHNSIHFDHGIRIALLMFNAERERRLPEPTIAECEAIRVHNWMKSARSSGKKTSIKTGLAEATAEMGKVTDTREIERAIPRVRYATDICLTKMSLGVKYIAAELTCETYAEIQASDTTYDGCHEGLRACKVADVAKELGLTTDQFALCLGLGWSRDVIRVDFGLEESTVIDLSETFGAMSVNEVLALMLAFGQQKFVAGPMMILAELIAECSIERLFLYLVIGKGDMKGLLALAEILKWKDARGYPEQSEAMKLS